MPDWWTGDPPSFFTPAAFLEALAKRLHTIPERVSSARALEELIAWLENMVAAGHTPRASFLAVALRPLYEETELKLPPNTEQTFALVERLQKINADACQPRHGKAWTG